MHSKKRSTEKDLQEKTDDIILISNTIYIMYYQNFVQDDTLNFLHEFEESDSFRQRKLLRRNIFSVGTRKIPSLPSAFPIKD